MKLLNDKKYLPVLLGLVIILWALIGYRFYDHFSAEEEIESIKVNMVKPSTNIAESSWVPSYKFDDPFLKNQNTKKSKTKIKKSHEVNKTVKSGIVNEKVSNLPVNVIFQGIITNAKSREKMAILNIADKTIFLIKDEQYMEMVLKEIYDDSIVINYQSQRFVQLKK